ncbi:hypothetical protein A3L23_05155 (plasmid) [Rhodococcoides fascians D188]|nr:hypothetical protein A3L23_05155 [Rhodococcus fascians D188]
MCSLLTVNALMVWASPLLVCRLDLLLCQFLVAVIWREERQQRTGTTGQRRGWTVFVGAQRLLYEKCSEPWP